MKAILFILFAVIAGITAMAVTFEPTTTEPITTEQITTEEITTEQITTEEIATDEVTNESIITEPITTEEITTEQITTEEITTEQITTEEITTEQITTEEITTEQITTEEVTTEEVTTEEITTEQITTEEITTEQITTEEITTEEVTTKEVTTETTITEEPPTFEAVPISGADYCIWGPTYWCQNATTAAQCDTTTYCIEKVWQQTNIEEIHDEVCDVCKEMVQQVRAEYESYRTQEASKKILQKYCDSMMIPSIVQGCNSFVDELFPELTEIIVSDLGVAVVCKVSGLCNSVFETNDLSAVSYVEDLRIIID